MHAVLSDVVNKDCGLQKKVHPFCRSFQEAKILKYMTVLISYLTVLVIAYLQQCVCVLKHVCGMCQCCVKYDIYGVTDVYVLGGGG